MFCPKCGDEFREEVKECADCQVGLVKEIPVKISKDSSKANHLNSRIVTVFSSGDPGLIMIAKSILDGAGIHYFAKGEGLQSVYGQGFNLSGQIRIQVIEENAEDAENLLKPLE